MDVLNIIFTASLGLQIVHGAKAEMVESMDPVFKFCSVPHHLDKILFYETSVSPLPTFYGCYEDQCDLYVKHSHSRGSTF